MSQRVSFACKTTEKKDENGDRRNIETGAGMDALLEGIRSKIPTISDRHVTTVKNIIYVAHHELRPGYPCIQALIEVHGIFEGPVKGNRTEEWDSVSGLYELRLYAASPAEGSGYRFTLDKLEGKPIYRMQPL